MKALSIRPPWAHAIAHLGKRVENRTWATRYRGPVLIHASSTKCAADLRELEEIVGAAINPDTFVSGAIIAVADLVDCVDGVEAPSRWTCGPIAWRLDNVRLLAEPVPVSGRLGLWTPTSTVMWRVLSQLAPVRGVAPRERTPSCKPADSSRAQDLCAS